MSDKYCPNCKRMVGTDKNYMPGVIVMCVAVALKFIPILGWFFMPFVFIVGVIMLICSADRCAICGSRNLLKFPPAEERQPEPRSPLAENKDVPAPKNDDASPDDNDSSPIA
jgi:hypothetical protein